MGIDKISNLNSFLHAQVASRYNGNQLNAVNQSGRETETSASSKASGALASGLLAAIRNPQNVVNPTAQVNKQPYSGETSSSNSANKYTGVNEKLGIGSVINLQGQSGKQDGIGRTIAFA